MAVDSVRGTSLRLPRSILSGWFSIAMMIAAGSVLLPSPGANAIDIVISGTRHHDHLRGTSLSDRIRALAGDDVAGGRGSLDRIFGGPGHDILRGGRGGEGTVRGGLGPDEVSGGDGDDRGVSGGRGRDEVHGGAGSDTLQLDRGADSEFGGPGSDHFLQTSGRDHLHGGFGDDFFVVRPDGRTDHIACGPGRDHVSLRSGRERRDHVDPSCEVVTVPQGRS